MINPKEPNITGELTDQDLEAVQGGAIISAATTIGSRTGPKASNSGSIAQGDTISNDDNLPDAGGNVII
jgi:hypothetical protein